jgi:flagellar export protein FliJ
VRRRGAAIANGAGASADFGSDGTVAVPRFRYRLQAALVTFVDRERQAIASHGAARAAHDTERRALEVLEERRRATGMRLRERRNGAGFEFGAVDAYLSALARVREKQLERVAAAHSRLAETRAILEAARLKRMALERHRDRARAEFDRVGALREASEFDESNALRTLFP